MTTDLITIDQTPTSTNLVVAPPAPLVAAARAADSAAAAHIFADYRRRKAARTRATQDSDLVRFRAFLASAGVIAGELSHDATAWQGISWGLVAAFTLHQLDAGYAIGTVNHALSTIKAYAKLALKAGAIDAAAYAMIKTVEGYGHTEGKRLDADRDQSRVGAKKAQPTPINRSQAQQLKQQPSGTPQGRRDTLMICILLDHGLRVGELAILPVSAFDLDRGTFTFYRPKVDITQTHRLSADTLRAFIAYQDYAPPSGAILRGSRKNGQLHGTMNDRSICARVRHLGEQLGIERLSPHDLRHAWATFATEAGTPINVLQIAGGWNSPKMPLRYINAAEIANEGLRL